MAQKKSNIHEFKTRNYFHEREIWFVNLGHNIGYEQDGKGEEFGRPIIVIRKFNNQILWAIPLSTKFKVGKYYMNINLNDNIHRIAILSQLRLIDSKKNLSKNWYR